MPRSSRLETSFTRLFALLALCLATSSLHAQRTWYVDKSAPPGGDGLSWDTAVDELRALLVAAPLSRGDEVWVAAGTYRPDLGTFQRTEAFFLPDGVRIFGGFAGGETERDQRDPDLNPTVLSGDLFRDDTGNFGNNGDNAFHVVVADGVGVTTVLDGFTIERGNANGAGTENAGGGILVTNGSAVRISNCIIARCSANTNGGGIRIDGGSTPVIDGCTITLCRATTSGADGGAIAIGGAAAPIVRNTALTNNNASDDGGAVWMNGAEATFDGCAFEGNAIDLFGDGGALFHAGGALSLVDCLVGSNLSERGRGGGIARSSGAGDLVLVRVVFDGNSTGTIDGVGGAIYNSASGLITVAECIFANCSAGGDGGAIYQTFGSATWLVVDTTFEGNSATSSTNDQGGAIYISGSPDFTLDGCTFADNVADGEGGAIYWTSASSSADLDILASTFVGNVSGTTGGAIRVSGNTFDPTEATITNSSFFGNIADGQGGAIWSNGFAFAITGCQFSGNAAGDDGGAISNRQQMAIINSTFNGNTASPDNGAVGGGIWGSSSSGTNIANSIFWNNTDSQGQSQGSQFRFETSNFSVNYTCVQNKSILLDGEGNIGDDPRFVDPDGLDDILGTADDDLDLSPGSPAVDAADNARVPGILSRDVRGGPRFIDDRDVPDRGNGLAPIVDMGAYERLSDRFALFLSGPAPTIVGQPSTITVTNATPGADITFAYALRLGETIIPNCSGLAADLRFPTILAVRRAGADGRAEFTFVVPDEGDGQTVRFQAVDRDNCVKSNVTVKQFD